MDKITWNNIAAPSLGESNSLFAQAIQSLKDAGTGLKDTAKDYQTVVRNRSHAILQDYINSAKTPEELQSEAFNIGFKNLQATLANEYDAVKVNDYRDSAVDKLTRRAGDAVALKRNEFGFAQDQLKAPTELDLLKTSLINAQTDADFKAKNNPLVLRSNTVTADNAEKTQAATIENANLAPTVTRHGMTIQDRAAATAEKNANTAAIEALARKAEADAKANPFETPQQKAINAVLNSGTKTLRDNQDAASKASTARAPYKDPIDYVDKTTAEGGINHQTFGHTSANLDAVIATLGTMENYKKLDPAVKASVLASVMNDVRAGNVMGKVDLFPSLQTNKYIKLANKAIEVNTGYTARDREAEKATIQDMVKGVQREGRVDEQTAWNIVHEQLGAGYVDGVFNPPKEQPTQQSAAATVTPVKQNRAPEVQALNEKYLKTKDLGEKLKLMHQMTQLQQQYEAGTK